MSKQDISSSTGLADGGTVSVSLDGLHQYDEIYVLVDDNAGGVPASYNLEFEASNASGGSGSMVVESLSGQTSRKHVFDPVPYDGTFTLTNASGASADYRLRVVAVDSQA